MGRQSGFNDRREADVVVVGAGLAGLMAARVVARAGLVPLVLEARDRVGGRVVNEPIGDDTVVEMGGQWVAPRDRRITALAAELGVDFFPTYDHGAQLLEIGHGVRRYRGDIPRLRPAALLEVGFARWQLDRRAKGVPAAAPWEAPRAHEWDMQTLGSWLDRTVRTREGRGLLDAAIASIWGEDPHCVSLLFALGYVNAAGNFDALGSTRGGLLQDRVVGGSGRLAQMLAAELGDRVVYCCAVEALVDRGASVEVYAGDTRVEAERAIVSVPPALASGLHFEPALPPVRQQALQQLPMGSVIKVAAVYERPFWRELGLSGRTVSVRGPVTSTFDNSPPDGRPGVLIGFVPGSRARNLASRPPAERRETVLASFSRLFGPDAGRPHLYVEKDWSADPWARGCYFGLPAPGALTGALRTLGQPSGRIHWAGSETALESYGGMDGALLSGERAATEALAALSTTVDVGP